VTRTSATRRQPPAGGTFGNHLSPAGYDLPGQEYEFRLGSCFSAGVRGPASAGQQLACVDPIGFSFVEQYEIGVKAAFDFSFGCEPKDLSGAFAAQRHHGF
jgi:hypothetical protein